MARGQGRKRRRRRAATTRRRDRAQTVRGGRTCRQVSGETETVPHAAGGQRGTQSRNGSKLQSDMPTFRATSCTGREHGEWP
eukprot:7278842-Lingulodinium_polyedra.AAC.1